MTTALAQDQPSDEDEIKDGKKGASSVILSDSESSSAILSDSESTLKLPTPGGVVVDAVTFLNRLVSDAVRH